MDRKRNLDASDHVEFDEFFSGGDYGAHVRRHVKRPVKNNVVFVPEELPAVFCLLVTDSRRLKKIVL